MITTGPVAEAIYGKTQDEIRETVIAAFLELSIPEQFIVNEHTVVINSLQRILLNDIPVLQVNATIDGISQELQYMNPPINVPDGTFSEETIEFYSKTKTIQIHNLKEDLDAALVIMVTDTVKVLIQRGEI